jgi:hypothetical protein
LRDVLLIIIGTVYGGYHPGPIMVTKEQCLAVVAEAKTKQGYYFNATCTDSQGVVIARTYKQH